MGLLPEKYDVFALFVTTKTGANFIAGTTERGITSDLPATTVELAEIPVGLFFTPREDRIGGNPARSASARREK